jgi:hypothetical protein
MILIIGDSHVIRMRKTLNSDARIKECAWYQDKTPPADHIPSECPEEHILSSGHFSEPVYFAFHKGRHAWGSDKLINEVYPCIKKVVKDDTIILPEFGYIDCKVQLVKHQNPEEAVTKYMDTFLNAFPNNKIRFIEPIPQFINNLGSGPDIYDFKDRYPMHKAFVYHLRKQSEERGLEKPFSPEEIFGVDKFDESYECHECAYCHEPQSIGMRWDHLKAQYNKQLLDHILSHYVTPIEQN